jgi:hypothetical protein
MTKYIRITLFLIVIVLAGALFRQCSLTARYFSEYKRAENNFKASQYSLASANTDSRAYQLTISELSYSKDSIIQKLKEVKDSLKVKNKNLISTSYVGSTASRLDTILIHGDTSFVTLKLI